MSEYPPVDLLQMEEIIQFESFLDVSHMKVKIWDSQSKFVFSWAVVGAIIWYTHILDEQITTGHRERIKENLYHYLKP